MFFIGTSDGYNILAVIVTLVAIGLCKSILIKCVDLLIKSIDL